MRFAFLCVQNIIIYVYIYGYVYSVLLLNVIVIYSYMQFDVWGARGFCTETCPARVHADHGRFAPQYLCLAMCASSRSIHRGVTALAYDLHRSVPADRWCVSYLDLAFLRQEVLSALGSGQIRPEPGEDASEAFGPSIYTVNEQYVKPVTWLAGKMSWALMRNPEGLGCDLFISHAWQEGIFEFMAKVRHSWPRGMRTAWCCMLANPQNLDISSFLKSPKTSPFAIALDASRVVLVVPNRHQSVYTRLWCSYEAYLAQEGGKTILIARSSNMLQIFRSLRWATLAALLGAGLGILAAALGAGQTFIVPAVTVLVCGFCLVIDNDGLRRVMHLVGVTLCWANLVRDFGGVFGDYAGENHGEGIRHEANTVVRRCYWLMSSICVFITEIDRINAGDAVAESEELQLGYRGSIQYAKCSQESDAASIRREIGHQVEQVDHAIHVLLAAGMSTPTLREIARSVDIPHAAFAELTGALFLLGPFATNAIDFVVLDMLRCQCLWYRVVLVIVSIVTRLMLFALLCRSDWDEQRFILKVMSKFLFVGWLCWLLLVTSSLVSHHISIDAVAHLWLAISDVFLLSMLAFALLGIRGTARLAFGFHILHFIFSRGKDSWSALTPHSCVKAASEVEHEDASAWDGSDTDSDFDSVSS